MRAGMTATTICPGSMTNANGMCASPVTSMVEIDNAPKAASPTSGCTGEMGSGMGEGCEGATPSPRAWTGAATDMKAGLMGVLMGLAGLFAVFF